MSWGCGKAAQGGLAEDYKAYGASARWIKSLHTNNAASNAPYAQV